MSRGLLRPLADLHQSASIRPHGPCPHRFVARSHAKAMQVLQEHGRGNLLRYDVFSRRRLARRGRDGVAKARLLMPLKPQGKPLHVALVPVQSAAPSRALEHAARRRTKTIHAWRMHIRWQRRWRCGSLRIRSVPRPVPPQSLAQALLGCGRRPLPAHTRDTSGSAVVPTISPYLAVCWLRIISPLFGTRPHTLLVHSEQIFCDIRANGRNRRPFFRRSGPFVGHQSDEIWTIPRLCGSARGGRAAHHTRRPPPTPTRSRART